MRTSWDKFVRDVNKLAEKLRDESIDVIVPLLRGGMVPAALLAEKFSIMDVRPVSVERRSDERIIVYPEVSAIGDIQGKKMLIIDDDAPTGGSLRCVKEVFMKNGASVFSAAVYIVPKSEKMWISTLRR